MQAKDDLTLVLIATVQSDLLLTIDDAPQGEGGAPFDFTSWKSDADCFTDDIAICIMQLFTIDFDLLAFPVGFVGAEPLRHASLVLFAEN